MTIETKANRGDIVYLMKDNRITTGEVMKIHATIGTGEDDKEEVGISYSLTGIQYIVWECQVFLDKESLLQSL